MVQANKKHDDSRIQEPRKNPGSRAYSLTHDKNGYPNGSNLNQPDKTTRSFVQNKGPRPVGRWRNSNGTTVGQSIDETGDIFPSKSTGDVPPGDIVNGGRLYGKKVIPGWKENLKQAAALKLRSKK